jgi:hypothetical protein
VASIAVRGWQGERTASSGGGDGEDSVQSYSPRYRQLVYAQYRMESGLVGVNCLCCGPTARISNRLRTDRDMVRAP